MKKLTIIFIGAALALVSCKDQTDGLASVPADDVYYNPAKEHKPNVPPAPEQYVDQKQNQQYDPNAGKIGATAADKNNPYYKDPNFNYDDYYDNAYAARIKRFNNPIYGTGYYDSYNTNSYFYNGNASNYGNSIYNNYGNGGYGYYSPSNSFNNAYYNPYYSGFGNSMGCGSGYGSGLSIGYGMGYGSGMGYGGYNPYSMCNSGYGYGGYNPYSYGMGYSPYGYGSGMGYGMGYGSGMGYGYSNSAGYGGYYNSYDFNSNSYSHNGPRGTHSGGNSTTTSPMPTPHHLMVNQPNVTGPPNSSPYNTERFNHVAIPKENYTKIVEAKNPVYNQMYAPTNTQQNGGGGRPIYNNGTTAPNGGYNNGGYNQSNGTYSQPRGGNGTVQPTNTNETKPHKWFNTSGTTGDNNNGGNNNGWGGSTGTGSGTRGGGFSGGSNGGGGSSGGSSGGSGGGGVARPHR